MWLPPWLGGGTSNALRDLVNRGVGEWRGLGSFTKYTLLSQESATLPLGPRGQALLPPVTGQGVQEALCVSVPLRGSMWVILSLQGILWCCMLLSSSTNGDSGLDKNGPRQSSWSRTDAYINIYDILPWSKVKKRQEIACWNQLPQEVVLQPLKSIDLSMCLSMYHHGEWNANHSSILAWRIPWTEDPTRFQSKGSQRVGHDWATKHMYRLSIQFHRVIIDIQSCGIQGNDLTYIYYEMIAHSDISHSSVVYVPS